MSDSDRRAVILDMYFLILKAGYFWAGNMMFLLRSRQANQLRVEVVEQY